MCNRPLDSQVRPDSLGVNAGIKRLALDIFHLLPFLASSMAFFL